MKIFFMIFVIGISLNVSADFSKCDELKSEQLRLGFIASNLANVNTTRTPEGGYYRPYLVQSCINGTCNVSRDTKPIMKYLPGHPDADENGYVAYPSIDAKSEYSAFNLSAAKLKLLVADKACGAKILIDNGDSSFLLRYDQKGQADIKEDMFNLNKNHRIVSWSRQDSKGKATTVNFASNGEISSHSHAD